ncbi:molybdopterin molybdotransferase MoeA [Subtercola frigoramans]|uniref:Molybdopterin molybdenumtransferase n=1 Tax=Subtercola frigoramans TaxID=120298 RepID=A0ABS2L704_9MICO|nr:gephyrin-like molybdotransferase Glp [Subtercola frigoramans]MBM7472859.1 molybdopterin molybdotransferase [Subtercola frigoramans]
MIRRTIDEHRDAIDALLGPLGAGRSARASEPLRVSADALAARPGDYQGRILAADVLSPTDLPGFDNSQMDGYAVSWFDLVTASGENPVKLEVAGQIAAGDPAGVLTPGTAAPIMTGAPVPPGADAVVPIEQAVPPRFPEHLPQGGKHATDETPPSVNVEFIEPVTPGAFIRKAGSDVSAGDVLLRAGSSLGPAQLGVIAGTGLREVQVLPRIRVLLVSTGHEIRDAGTTLEPGQIFDSNSVALSLAIIETGCEVRAIPCRSDDAEVLLAILSANAPWADIVVTVGGVSAGAREVVRDALTPLGVVFGKVAMQPGGPQGFGLAAIPAAATDVAFVRPVICMPGNPVSALVTFEMFLRAPLRRLAGQNPAERLREVAMTVEAVDSPLGVHQIRRGFVDDEGTVTLVGGTSSHLLHSYASSNVLVHIPADVAHLDAGDPVMVWRIDD